MTDFVDQGVEVILRADKTYRWQGLPNTPFKIELRDNDDVVVASLDRTGKIVSPSLATVDTAGEGYFFGGHVYPQVTTGSNPVVNGIDQVQTLQFVLPYRVTFNRVVTRVKVVGGAGKLYGVALYNAAKELIVESGALDANTIAINNTTIDLTLLEPGVYWFAQTSDSTSTACTTFNESEVLTITAAIDTPRQGPATNTAPAPGTFPATLGPTLGGTVRFPVVALFGRE